MKITVHILAGDTDANGTFADAFATDAEREEALLSHLEDSDDYTATPDGFARFVADEQGDMVDFMDRHRAEHLDTFSWDSQPVDFDLCAQPLPATGREQVAEAIECLKRARDLLKAANNKRTLERVRLALSSAKGAARIQTSRAVRTSDAMRRRVAAELHDAHEGEGNGGTFDDWVRKMADDERGTLQRAAQFYLGEAANV